MLDLNEITPVEQTSDGLFFKRDDKFRPFGEHHVNGGKVRQAFAVFENKIDELRNVFDNGVVTAGSVHSPQSANIAKVAQYYGVRCIATVGGTTSDRLKQLPMMQLTQYYGSEVRIVAGHGMTAVIHARMHEIAKEMNYMPIEMGELMLENPKSIFETTANQVQNIPDDLDYLVVPTGVAIQLTGILIGLKRYNKKVRNIFSICVGPTREKQVAKYLKTVYNDNVENYSPFKMIAHKAPYSKSYPTTVKGEKIDDIYEGKAFDWLIKNRDINTKNDKVLFWVVGSRPQNVDYIIGNNL